MTIVSLDSSGASSAKKFLDLNSLRSAAISGGASSTEKKSEGSDDQDKKPSFESLLNALINDQMTVDKQTEVKKADEAVSQLHRPRVVNDGFNHGGARIDDWGPGRSSI
ncbi:hypothetical protein EBR57_00620 [bacterium]|nr:hypothetical protein [bacterium]